MTDSCNFQPSAVVVGSVMITTQPYTHGSKAIYQCRSGYAMSGDPYVTCNNGAFTGPYPKCNIQDMNEVYAYWTDSSTRDDIPHWLFYLIAALVALVMLSILGCLLACCCQMLGFNGGGGGGGGGMLGSSSSAAAAAAAGCCRRGHGDDGYYTRQCRNFPRRYLYDENGRRFHFDDVGRACYYNHKHQNGKVVVAPADSSVITVESHDKRVAKEVATWMPHANPVRPINTSTR